MIRIYAFTLTALLPLAAQASMYNSGGSSVIVGGQIVLTGGVTTGGVVRAVTTGGVVNAPSFIIIAPPTKTNTSPLPAAGLNPAIINQPSVTRPVINWQNFNTGGAEKMALSQPVNAQLANVVNPSRFEDNVPTQMNALSPAQMNALSPAAGGFTEMKEPPANPVDYANGVLSALELQ